MDQLNARVIIAYTRLPPKTIPNIKIQVQSLGEKSLNILFSRLCSGSGLSTESKRLHRPVHITQGPSTVSVPSRGLS